jgi:hypothetical protein
MIMNVISVFHHRSQVSVSENGLRFGSLLFACLLVCAISLCTAVTAVWAASDPSEYEAAKVALGRLREDEKRSQ